MTRAQVRIHRNRAAKAERIIHAAHVSGYDVWDVATDPAVRHMLVELIGEKGASDETWRMVILGMQRLERVP